MHRTTVKKSSPRLFIMESVSFPKSPLPQSGVSPYNVCIRFFFFTQDWLFPHQKQSASTLCLLWPYLNPIDKLPLPPAELVMCLFSDRVQTACWGNVISNVINIQGSVSHPLWDRGPVNSLFIRRGPDPNKFTRKYLSIFLSSYIKLT